jgi:hypothetical protein
MFIKFFGVMGVVHFEFIPYGRTVNQAYYMGILKCLCEAVRRKIRKLWPKDWILRYDIISSHKALGKSFWLTNFLLK